MSPDFLQDGLSHDFVEIVFDVGADDDMVRVGMEGALEAKEHLSDAAFFANGVLARFQ